MSNKRYYEDDGKRYPRCTSICGQLDKSGPLTYWAAGCACDYIIEHHRLETYYVNHAYDMFLTTVNQARKEFRSVSDKALNIGSAVHAAIEHYLKTGEEPQDPPDQVLAGFIAFLEWEDEHIIKVYETELTV